ncbi:hypothetical protein GCM10027614_51190 [Micromonospora vulcania]
MPGRGGAQFGEFEFGVFAAEHVAEFGGAFAVAGGGGQGDRVVGAGAFQAFQDLFLGDLEVGGDVGDGRGAPRVCSRELLASEMARRSSCSRRGTRMSQVRSRKCRLSSPTMVGIA